MKGGDRWIRKSGSRLSEYQDFRKNIEYLNPKRFDGCVLKKQTQFSKESNVIKVNYNREIREKYWIGHLVKTKPKKPNFG